MKSPQIEVLKQLLSDNKIWLTEAIILAVAPAAERSVIRVKARTMPAGNELIARCTWSSVGANSGMYGPVNVGDMVIIGIAGGDEDSAYVLARLSSAEDLIPKQAIDGDTIIKAVGQLKLHLASLSRINIGLGDYDAQPAENLVLGQVFKQMMIDVLNTCISLCNEVAAHTHIDSMGVKTTAPMQASSFLSLGDDYSTIKASPVQDEGVLSDIAFTEKG